jgi:hypothetical protein
VVIVDVTSAGKIFQGHVGVLVGLIRTQLRSNASFEAGPAALLFRLHRFQEFMVCRIVVKRTRG